MAHGQQVRFSTVYSKGGWKSGGVLSGSGSRIDTTGHLRGWIEDGIESGRIGSILDLGCGDLTWISHIEGVASRMVRYYGVDVVPELIAHNKRIFPWFQGEAKDLEEFPRVSADLIIIKDVLPHHCNGTAGQILKLANSGTWKFLLVTSDPGSRNKKRARIKDGMWVHYNVEESKIIEGEVCERLHRPDGGEYQVWIRRPNNH